MLITVGGELLVPLVEIGINVWNVVKVNEMIKDPESGYGKEYIFDSFFKELDPWVALVTPSPTPIGMFLNSLTKAMPIINTV